MEYEAELFDHLLLAGRFKKDTLRVHFIAATLATHIRKMSQIVNPNIYVYNVRFSGLPLLQGFGKDGITNAVLQDTTEDECQLKWSVIKIPTTNEICTIELVLAISGKQESVYRHYNKMNIQTINQKANDFVQNHLQPRFNNLTEFPIVTISKPGPRTYTLRAPATTNHIRVLDDNVIQAFISTIVTVPAIPTVNSSTVSLEPYLQAALWLDYEYAYFTSIVHALAKNSYWTGTPNSDSNTQFVQYIDTFVERAIIRTTAAAQIASKIPGTFKLRHGETIYLNGYTLKSSDTYNIQYPTSTTCLIQGVTSRDIRFSDGDAYIEYNPEHRNFTYEFEYSKNVFAWARQNIKLILTWNGTACTVSAEWNDMQISTKPKSDKQFKQLASDETDEFGCLTNTYTYRGRRVTGYTPTVRTDSIIFSGYGLSPQYGIFFPENNTEIDPFRRCRLQHILFQSPNSWTYIFKTGERLYGNADSNAQGVKMISFRTSTGKLLKLMQTRPLRVMLLEIGGTDSNPLYVHIP